MKRLFQLVKDDVEFSKTEVLSLYKPDKYEITQDLLFFDTNKDFTDRLALTKRVYNLIEISKDIELSVENIDWNNIIEGSFKVRCDNRILEKKLADKIHSKLESPKVDLKNPDSYIQIFVRDNSFFICVLDKIVSTSWKNRLPHMKPELSPTSLNPRIAIAMINLAGISKGILCDPFCGTGGLLVEAGLLEYRIIGFDIDKISLNKAKINLKHYDIKTAQLLNEDALKNNETYEKSSNLSQAQTFDFVVTDLPYGLNTKISEGLESLYKSFFKKYYDLCDTMIVGLPDFVDYNKLLSNWKVQNIFTVYHHKSLSKKILKLTKL